MSRRIGSRSEPLADDSGGLKSLAIARAGVHAAAERGLDRGGDHVALPSSALRSSCSRRAVAGGALDARERQALAGVDEAAGEVKASEGSRAEIDRGEGNAAAGGSPRRVDRIAVDARCHHQEAGALSIAEAMRGQMRRGPAGRPSADPRRRQGWAVGRRAPRPPPHRAFAAIPRGVVHRVIERAPFAELRQIEEIIQEDELLLRDRSLIDQTFGSLAPVLGRGADERSRRLCSRLRIGSCPLPTPKSRPGSDGREILAPRRSIAFGRQVWSCRCRPRRARKRRARSAAERGLEDALELLKFRLAADECAASCRRAVSPLMPVSRHTLTGASMPLSWSSST